MLPMPGPDTPVATDGPDLSDSTLWSDGSADVGAPAETTNPGDVAPSSAPDAADLGPDALEEVAPPEPIIDACLNEADQAAWAAITQESYQTAFQGCGGACFAVKTCIAPCLEDALGFSPDCASCMAYAIACSVAYCIGPCQAGDGCQWCALQNGCWSQFTECAGMGPVKFD